MSRREKGPEGTGAAGGSAAAPVRRSKRLAARSPAVVREPAPPHSINLLDLPTEVLLLILEQLLALDPITLLGAVPGVCKRMRAVCDGVRGEFDLRGEWARLRMGNWSGAKGALMSAGRLVEEDGSRVDEAGGDRGATPLYMACLFGHLEIAQLLVEKGVDVDKAMNDGTTPLYFACMFGHLEVVRLLVGKGADMDGGMGSASALVSVGLTNIGGCTAGLPTGARVSMLPTAGQRTRRRSRQWRCSVHGFPHHSDGG